MHIPDGFLTTGVALPLDAISAAGVLVAARRLKAEAAGRMIPVMGMLSAFVFAAQMLNFPVLGGTSGHLMGGALLAILLGPTAGFLAMAAVVIAQALFLQDGGLIALGANLFNIGAVATWGGYCIYRLAAGPEPGPRRAVAAAFAAGWFSLEFSALSCALQLALSGVVPLAVAVPAMCGYHAVIGVAEGALTAGILSILRGVRPDLARQARFLTGLADWVGAALLVALPYVLLVVAGSSDLPDPLEGLLEASELRGSGPGSGTLLSPERMRGYALSASVIIIVIALIFLGRSLLREKKERP